MAQGTWRVDSKENKALQDQYFWDNFKKNEKEAFLAPNAKGRQTVINAYGKNLPEDYKATEEAAFAAAEEFKEGQNSQTKEITKKEDSVIPQQSKFEDLRYPYTSIDGTQDFIKFTIVEYKRKASGRLVGGPSLNSDLLGNIILPIPSQLTDANSVDYGQGSLNFVQETALNAGSSLIAGNVDRFKASINRGINQMGNAQDNEQLVSNWFAMKAVNALGLGGAVNFNQLTARSSGAVINPNMELLFNGPTLRNFSFQFKFTPRFQQESEAVKSIIRTFKKNMAPRKGKGTAMLKTPNVFQIQYVGKAKQYLNNIKLCALRNISTNYTADGNFTTYADGAPISSTIVLSFTELIPIYNEDYDESVGGVGY